MVGMIGDYRLPMSRRTIGRKFDDDDDVINLKGENVNSKTSCLRFQSSNKEARTARPLES